MITIENLVAAHNEIREGRNLSTLVSNPLLTGFAQQWAQAMADNRRLRHSNMRDISALGFKRVGENIAMGATTVEAVMRMWMRSPGHRRNILSPGYTDIGCGYADSGNGRPYWCVCFGVPK